MAYVVLMKKSLADAGEYDVAKEMFPVYTLRTEIPKGSKVIHRYSAIPCDFRELELDLKNLGSSPINSYQQQQWITEFDYYEEFKDITPQSWLEREFPYSDYPGPFIVKGRTNSRKIQWRTKMFAATRADAINVASELSNDPIIGPQGIIYRKYTPLKTYEYDIAGLPITNEHRFFFYQDKLIAYGYYWSQATVVDRPTPPEAVSLAKRVAERAKEYINFFVVDVAETEIGEWILIELNDGQQSGLSMIDHQTFYKNLKEALP